MDHISDFLDELERFIKNNFSHLFYSYTRSSSLGAFLIKDLVDNKKTLFKYYDTSQNIGFSRLQKSIVGAPTFRGKKIHNYIYIGQSFRDNSKRFTAIDSALTLLEVDLERKEISVYGSRNIDKGLLNVLIDFSEGIKFEIDYDFKGVILKHTGEKNGLPQVKSVEKRVDNLTVFISYSWDNERHKSWVLKLAATLIRMGINVIIDQWDLKNYNDDLNLFIESGIRESQYVIIICTKRYANKANKREGGVGIEQTIITGEFYEKITANKFIPIIRDGTKGNRDENIKEYLPSYLKTRYAIDFRDDLQYESKIDELIRKIYDVPKYKRPPLGPTPRLIQNDI
jgi:hypothetical protein